MRDILLTESNERAATRTSYPAVLGWVVLLALLVTRLLDGGSGKCTGGRPSLDADICTLVLLSAFGCSPEVLPPTVSSSPVCEGAVPLAPCCPVSGPAGPGPPLWAPAMGTSFSKTIRLPGIPRRVDNFRSYGTFRQIEVEVHGAQVRQPSHAQRAVVPSLCWIYGKLIVSMMRSEKTSELLNVDRAHANVQYKTKHSPVWLSFSNI